MGWKSKSALDTWQQDLGKRMSQWLSGKIGTATEFLGPLYTEYPKSFFDAYGAYLSAGGEDNAAIRESLLKQAKGTPWYTMDTDKVARDWTTGVAEPTMEMWNQSLLPLVKRQYAVPGGFESGEMNRGVYQEGERFYKGSVFPTLFTAQEAEKQRFFEANQLAQQLVQPASQMLSDLPFRQFSQQALSAQEWWKASDIPRSMEYADFLRKQQEMMGYVNPAVAVSMTPTIENIYKSSSGKTSGIGSLVGGIAGAMFAPSLGFTNALQGGMFGMLAGGGLPF